MCAEPVKPPAGSQRQGPLGQCLAVMPPAAARRGRGRGVLVTRDIDELAYGMSSMSTLCHVVGRAMVAVGLTMVGRKVWKQLRRWRVRLPPLPAWCGQMQRARVLCEWTMLHRRAAECQCCAAVRREPLPAAPPSDPR